MHVAGEVGVDVGEEGAVVCVVVPEGEGGGVHVFSAADYDA